MTPMNSTFPERPSLFTEISYAAPAFALAVVGIPVYVYLPKFYTDSVGIHIAALGYILLAVRIFDAITDPFIGALSDRTTTRWGRRRPYMAVGSILLAVTVILLFNPPHASEGFETVWFTVWIFITFLFWTVVTVPYEALGPEITFDYDARTRLFGLRDGALIAGTLAAAVTPAAIAWGMDLGSGAAEERTKFFVFSVGYAPFLIAMCWWCVFAVRELPAAIAPQRSNIAATFKQVIRNRPFVILIAAYTVAAFGSNLPATLILYYVEYVLQSPRADLFLVMYFVVGILLLPAWVAAARRIGKKRAWLAAMAVNTVAFVFVFFLGPGDEVLYGILVVLSGVGFGATVALPSALQADVIDYDELMSGERREGRYIGAWSVAKKLAAALGVGIALSVLGVVGYEPNVPQTEGVVFTLRVLYALVPCLCNAAAFIIALAYPIDRDTHVAIRQAVEDRKQGKAFRDPLLNGS